MTVSRLRGHTALGPSWVAAQSKARMRAAISLGPANGFDRMRRKPRYQTARPAAIGEDTPPPKPTAAGLLAAVGATIPDLVARDLDVLFCGINPGLYSAAT